MWVLLGILKFGSKMLIKFLNPMFSIVKNGRISEIQLFPQLCFDSSVRLMETSILDLNNCGAEFELTVLHVCCCKTSTTEHFLD